MSNKNNVAVGKPKIGGAIHIAPSGTALPTDATTALTSAFVNLGFVSEDGMTNDNKASVKFMPTWGGVDIAYTGHESNADTYKWTLLEVLDENVQKFIRGSENVTVSQDGSISVKVNSGTTPAQVEEHVIVVEMILHERAVRHVIPRGVISELGTVTYVDDDAVGYEVTVSALPDSEGNTHYEYFAAPAASSNSGSGSGDSGSGSGG